MKAIRPLIIFAGKALLIYILFITAANVANLDKLFRNFYLQPATLIANNAYKNANISCEKLDGSKTGDDIIFTFSNKLSIEKARQEAKMTGQAQTNIKGFKWSFNTYRVELIFILFLFSLTLAFSSDWKHKLKGLLLSLGIYFSLSFIFLHGRIISQIDLNKNIFPEFDLSAAYRQALSVSTNMHTEAMFLIVLFIWGIIFIRKSDFENLIKQ